MKGAPLWAPFFARAVPFSCLKKKNGGLLRIFNLKENEVN
jgi:hypothetical protein